jgi:uncharacterized membrane protein
MTYYILPVTVLIIPSGVILTVFIWYWFKGAHQ